MLHDVTITLLLCLCIICYKTDVYPPADSFVNGSTSVETLRFRSECPAFIRQTWSSLILAQRSIVRTIFDSSWEWVCCLISKQDVANTNGHFNRMVCQRTQYVIPQIIWRKRRLILSSLTCSPQTGPILILLTVLFGGPFSKESTTEENSTQWKSWIKLNWIELDGKNSGSWFHCLPIRIYHWQWEGDCTAVVCEAVCCTIVRPGL